MTAPTDPDPQLTRRTVTADRSTASVIHLLDDRGDLRGVAPMADLFYDAVRWTA